MSIVESFVNTFQAFLLVVRNVVNRYIQEEQPEILFTIDHTMRPDDIPSCSILDQCEYFFGVRRLRDTDSMDTDVINSFPCISINGEEFSGKYGLLHYCGRLTHYHPQEKHDALIVDEWLDFHIKFREPLNSYRLHASFQKADIRAWCKDIHIPHHLSILERTLKNQRWLGNMSSKSIADACWYAEFKLLLKEEWVASFDEYEEIKNYIIRLELDFEGSEVETRRKVHELDDEISGLLEQIDSRKRIRRELLKKQILEELDDVCTRQECIAPHDEDNKNRTDKM